MNNDEKLIIPLVLLLTAENCDFFLIFSLLYILL